MIYLDLIDGNLAIDWERFDRDRHENWYTSTEVIFTHEAIAILTGTPANKLKQLQAVLINSQPEYSYMEHEGSFYCRCQWQSRTGYGSAKTKAKATSLAQTDLLKVLPDFPIDAYRHDEIWDSFIPSFSKTFVQHK